MIGVLRGKIKMQTQPGRGPFVVLGQGDLILIFGGLLSVFQIVVIGGTVQTHAFDP